MVDHLVVAFPLWLQPPTGGAGIEDPYAGDLFVMAHLGFFFLLLSGLGLFVWQIWRRSVHPEPHVQLLMELADEQADDVTCGQRSEPLAAADEATASPWERAADWWQK